MSAILSNIAMEAISTSAFYYYGKNFELRYGDKYFDKSNFKILHRKLFRNLAYMNIIYDR